MDPVSLALMAISIFLKRPRGTPGGTSRTDSALLIDNLIQLIEGGRKTHKALKAWAEEIHGMAERGEQPTPAHFDSWTARLDEALSRIEEAKQKLGPEPEPEQPAENQGSLDLNSSAPGAGTQP